jgi:hypothetical protein
MKLDYLKIRSGKESSYLILLEKIKVFTDVVLQKRLLNEEMQKYINRHLIISILDSINSGTIRNDKGLLKTIRLFFNQTMKKEVFLDLAKLIPDDTSREIVLDYMMKGKYVNDYAIDKDILIGTANKRYYRAQNRFRKLIYRESNLMSILAK